MDRGGERQHPRLDEENPGVPIETQRFADWARVETSAGLAGSVLGATYRTETHYKARRRGWGAPYAALCSIEAARYMWIPAIAAALPMYFSNKTQHFFDGDTTVKATEHQEFMTLIVGFYVAAGFTLVGHATRTYLGHKPYKDPRPFRDYFYNLGEAIAANRSLYQLIFPSNTLNYAEAQDAYRVHRQIFNELLRDGNTAAAAYMLRSFTGSFGYHWPDRYVPATAAVSSVDRVNPAYHRGGRRGAGMAMGNETYHSGAGPTPGEVRLAQNPTYQGVPGAGADSEYSEALPASAPGTESEYSEALPASAPALGNLDAEGMQGRSADDIDDGAFGEAVGPDRDRNLRMLYCERMGICTPEQWREDEHRYSAALDNLLREIQAHVDELLEGDVIASSADEKLQSFLRGFRVVLRRLLNDYINPDQQEGLGGEINIVLNGLEGNIRNLLSGRVRLGDISLENAFARIITLFTQGIHDHFKEPAAAGAAQSAAIGAASTAIWAWVDRLYSFVRPLLDTEASAAAYVQDRGGAAPWQTRHGYLDIKPSAGNDAHSEYLGVEPDDGRSWRDLDLSYDKDGYLEVSGAGEEASHEDARAAPAPAPAWDEAGSRASMGSFEVTGGGMIRARQRSTIRRRTGDIFRNRRTASTNARRLAALNQAFLERGIDLVLDPMSGGVQLFDRLRGGARPAMPLPAVDPADYSQPARTGDRGRAARGGGREAGPPPVPPGHPSDRPRWRRIDDPLHHDLINGNPYTTCLSVSGDRLFSKDYRIEGYHNTHTQNEGLTDAVGQQLLDIRRKAAREGWLYPGSHYKYRLPEKIQRLRVRHPDWILPECDAPGYEDYFNYGSSGIYLAEAMYAYTQSRRQGRKEAGCVEDQYQFLVHFLEGNDPLENGFADPYLVEQLHNQGLYLAIALRGGGYYRHWEHWIAHDRINTKAFMKLTPKQQAQLMLRLFTGPSIAILTAKSILHDPLFLNTTFNVTQRRRIRPDSPFNAFMRAWDAVCQTIIASGVPVIRDLRVTVVNSLIHIMDPSVGREVDSATHDVISPGLVTDTVRQHTRKSAHIFTRLLHSLSDNDAAFKLQRLRGYHETLPERARNQINLATTDEADLQQQLIKFKYLIDRKIQAGHANAGLTDDIRFELNLLDEYRDHALWLITRLKGRLLACHMFRDMPAGQEATDVVTDVLRENPRYVELGAEGAIQPNMDDEVRQRIWERIIQLIQDPGGDVAVREFLIKHHRSLMYCADYGDPVEFQVLKECLHELGATPMTWMLLRVMLCVLYHVHKNCDVEVQQVLHALYVTFRSQDNKTLLQYYAAIVTDYADLDGVGKLPFDSLIDAHIQSRQERLGNDVPEVNILCMTGAGETSLITESQTFYNDGTPTEKVLSLMVLKACLKHDRLRRSDEHGEHYLVHAAIVAEMNQGGSDLDLYREWARLVIHVNLRLLKRNEGSRLHRLTLIYEVLEAYAKQCSQLDQGDEQFLFCEEHGPNFSAARALLRFCSEKVLSETDARHIAATLLSLEEREGERVLKPKYPEMIWFYVNYGIKDISDKLSRTDADLSTAQRMAGNVLKYLSDEHKKYEATDHAQLRCFVATLNDKHSCLGNPHKYNIMSKFVMMMLKEYSKNASVSKHNAAVMVSVFRAFYRTMSHLMPLEYSEHVPRWIINQFKRYLENAYPSTTEMEANCQGKLIYMRFKEGQQEPGDRRHWERFRLTMSLGHNEWMCSNQDVAPHILPWLITLVENGFSAGYDLSGEKRHHVIEDSWYILIQILGLDSGIIIEDHNRLLPVFREASKLVELRHYPNLSQCDWKQFIKMMQSILHFRERFIDDEGTRDCLEMGIINHLVYDMDGHYLGDDANAEDRCDTWEKLMIACIHVLFRQRPLALGVFIQFSVDVMPQLIRRGLRAGVQDPIEDDFKLINRLWNNLPEARKNTAAAADGEITPEVHINRQVRKYLVLAYAYWKFKNSGFYSFSHRTYAMFSAIYDDETRELQAMARGVFGAGVDNPAALFPNALTESLGLDDRGAFISWLRQRLDSPGATPPAEVQMGSIQDGDDAEAQPLLGNVKPRNEDAKGFGWLRFG